MVTVVAVAYYNWCAAVLAISHYSCISLLWHFGPLFGHGPPVSRVLKQ